MRRKPWIALLLCCCSCSLDTSPDIAGAHELDASLSASKRQQASLRFDTPLPPRKSVSTAVKRMRRDDTDAGDGPKDAKPESRDAGRAASARPALSSARDAGPMDAGAKQTSTGTQEPPATSGDVTDDSAKGHSPDASSEHAAADSSHSSEERNGSSRRHRGRDEHEARGHRRDDDNERDNRRGRDRGSDDGENGDGR